jgi:hypothetical protein
VADPLLRGHCHSLPSVGQGRGAWGCLMRRSIRHSCMTCCVVFAWAMYLSHLFSSFADDRWDTLRSSATWLSWQLTLQRHGLPVSRDVWATGHERSRGPILDLLLLGGCPDANPAVLRDLCVELAPYLHSASMDHRMEESSPLTWEPVTLHPDAALFTLTDSTAGSAAYGPYDTSTRDGLVRVERAGHHVETVKQSRFGLLSAAYDPEELCQALPAWIAAIIILV